MVKVQTSSRTCSPFYILFGTLDTEDGKARIGELTEKFYCSLDLADLYYVFHGVHCFIEQPFTSFMPEALLNMARYLVLRTLKSTPKGISKVYPIHTYIAMYMYTHHSIS